MNAAILDDVDAIKALDSANMLSSIELLPEQMRSVMAEAKTVVVPARYKKARQIVVGGMGGSTLASHTIKAVFAKELSVSLEIINGYQLPKYVGRDTLVMISSYSGTTEEAAAMLEDALRHKALPMVITSGGKLAEIARKKKLPAIIFSARDNPCGSPRMGLGYSLVGQLALLSATEFLRFRPADTKLLLGTIAASAERWGVGQKTSDNIAKQFAVKTAGRSVWYAGAEHLMGSAHTGANQMNENAKRFAGYFAVPELNHHLMEGMLQPASNRESLLFVLLESELYDKRVQKRFEITKAVLDKNGISHMSLKLSERKPLSQAVEALVFTSYSSYYSALIENIDPTAIPFVDFFKEQLKK